MAGPRRASCPRPDPASLVVIVQFVSMRRRFGTSNRASVLTTREQAVVMLWQFRGVGRACVCKSKKRECTSVSQLVRGRWNIREYRNEPPLIRYTDVTLGCTGPTSEPRVATGQLHIKRNSTGRRCHPCAYLAGKVTVPRPPRGPQV
eukprot:scaffold3743_cov389-Prasinococcus_capsulatus_cf.AAC.16